MMLCALAANAIASPVEAGHKDNNDDPCLNSCKFDVVVESLWHLGYLDTCAIVSDYVACLESCTKRSSQLISQLTHAKAFRQQVCHN